MIISRARPARPDPCTTQALPEVLRNVMPTIRHEIPACSRAPTSSVGSTIASRPGAISSIAMLDFQA
ncbi:hypothetical protein ACFPRL_23430 [Pseudoclavibacter helvolus]